jgi:RNA polymerase sigma factor (sigma-70 family)
MNHISFQSSYLHQLSGLHGSYRHTYRIVQQARETAAPGDKHLMTGMLTDVQYAIDWMGTGICPGNRRGIERRAAYQREKLMDPIHMQTYIEQQTVESRPSSISEQQRARLDQALSRLSRRERECYELHYGMCYSLQDIASLLGLKKGSVQYYLQAAVKKLQLVKS